MYAFLSSKSRLTPSAETSAKPQSKSPLTIFPSQSPLTLPADNATTPQAAATSSKKVPLQNIALMTRQQLEEQVRKYGDNTDPNVCFALGKLLLKAGMEGKIDRVKYMKTGLLLMEAGYKRDAEIVSSDVAFMATGYSALWLTAGVMAESYLLERSAELFQSMGEIETPANLLCYCRVLQFLNRLDDAAGVITSLLSTTDGDPEYPSYLFYAGDIFKAKGMYDQAASYFFEATQLGPPRLFSKLEMMFITSRNIEEAAKERDEPCEEAYQIVFDYMLKEGHVEEGINYDAWVNDSQIWMELGHKCSIHGAHSLARDLYGQALLRDHNSYRKTKIWFMFSKSCNLCGLASDAQLSIRQSLTVEPHNAQLLRALKSWTENSQTFKSSVESITTSLPSIVEEIPKEIHIRDLAIKRIQGLFRGAHERSTLSAGQLRKAAEAARVAEGGVKKKGSTLRKMQARFGVLFQSIPIPKIGAVHPLVFTVRADWSGRIRFVTVLDVVNGIEAKLPLPSGVFAPGLEYGKPRLFKLQVACRREGAEEQSDYQDLYTSHYFGNRGQREKTFFRPVSRNTIERSVANLPPKGACEGIVSTTVSTDLVGQQILSLQFTDISTGQYIAKQYVLASLSTGGSSYQMSNLMDSLIRVDDVLRASPRGSPRGSRPSSPRSPRGQPESKKMVSILETLSLAEVAGASSAVFVDIPAALVGLGGLRWRQQFFLYRVNHHYHRTHITCQQVSSNLMFRVTVSRIHIDRGVNLKRLVNNFLCATESCEPFMKVLDTGGAEDVPDDSLLISKAVRFKDQLLLLRLRLSQMPLRSKYCALIEVVDPTGESILGNQFAVLDRSAVPSERARSITPGSFGSLTRVDTIEEGDEEVKVVEDVNEAGALDVATESAVDVPQVPTVEEAIPPTIQSDFADMFLPPTKPAMEEPTVVEVAPIEEPVAFEPAEQPIEPISEDKPVEVPVEPSETTALDSELVIEVESAPAERPPLPNFISPEIVSLATSTVEAATLIAQSRVSSRAATPMVAAPVSPPKQLMESNKELPVDDKLIAQEPALELETTSEPKPDEVLAGKPAVQTAQVSVEPVLADVDASSEQAIESSTESPVQAVIEVPFPEARQAEVAAPMMRGDSFASESDSFPVEISQHVQRVDSNVGRISRMDTNQRLAHQIEVKKYVSAIKTFNFLEQERMRLEAAECLYRIGRGALAAEMRSEALAYLLARCVQAKEFVRNENEAIAKAAADAVEAERRAAEELAQQKEREELRTPTDKKGRTPPTKLKKGQSERFASMRKSASTRSISSSKSAATSDEDSTGPSRGHLRQSKSGRSVTSEISGLELGPILSQKDNQGETGREEDDRSTSSSVRDDFVSAPPTAPSGQPPIPLEIGSSGSSSLRGTLSTASKGEPRFMNSILDAMKARDLRMNATNRGADFTIKQKLLLRDPVDVNALPDYAFDSAEGLVVALQAQDREYEAYLQRKAARDLQRMEQMQLIQQQQVAMAIQKEKDLAALRRAKKGDQVDLSLAIFGPPKPAAQKRKRKKSNHHDPGKSIRSGDLSMFSQSNEGDGLDEVKLESEVYQGNFIDGIRNRTSSWLSDDMEYSGEYNGLDFSEEDEDPVLPPLPVNAEYSQTLFVEKSATGSFTPHKRQGSLASRSLSSVSPPKRSDVGKLKDAAAKGKKLLGVSGRVQPATIQLGAFEKPPVMIAEGHDPMEFMLKHDRGGSEPYLPGETLCQGLLDTYRMTGYLPPESNGGKFSSQWNENIQSFLDRVPELNNMRKYIFALQKSHPFKLTRLEAFCALASVKGKVPDALGKMLDQEFGMEVGLACQVLPIKAIVSRYPGLYELLFENENTAARAASPFRAKSKSRSRSKSPQSPIAKMMSRSLPIDSNGPLPHFMTGRISPVEDSPPGSRGTSPKRRTRSPGYVEYATDDHIRIKGIHAAKKLPHLNMLQSSHAVRSRSTEVSLARDKRDLEILQEEQQKQQMMFSSIAAESTLSGFFPAISSISTKSLPPPKLTSSKSFKRQMSTGDDMTFEPAEASNFQDGGRPNSRNKANNELSVTFADETWAGNVASSARGDGSKLASMRAGGSIKVEKIVDEISSPQLLIMTRKDAYRAMEDETLAKSSKIKFRKLSTKEKVERRVKSSSMKMASSDN